MKGQFETPTKNDPTFSMLRKLESTEHTDNIQTTSSNQKLPHTISQSTDRKDNLDDQSSNLSRATHQSTARSGWAAPTKTRNLNPYGDIPDVTDLRYKTEPKFGDEAREWAIGQRIVPIDVLNWSMPYPKKPTGTGPGPSDYYPNYHIAKPRLFDPYFEKLKPNPPEPLYDSEKLFPNPNYES